MKVAIATLGCKVNQYEGSLIAKELSQSSKVEFVSFNDAADVYIVNSCAVTSEADRKSKKLVSKAKAHSSDAHIIVAGCLSELSPDNLKKAGATHVLGNNDKKDIAELVAEMAPQVKLSKEPRLSPSRTRVVVKVQDGCDQFCSYCIIPYLRGELDSRDESEVLEEVRSLHANGVKEVVLTGIHLGKYGVDKRVGTDLYRLLLMLLEKSDISRLRLSSIEPFEVDDKLIELIGSTDRVADHLHIPLQSGSDRVLKLMNRPYDSKSYAELIENLGSSLPNVAITTDVITGFPGETDHDYQSSFDLISRLNFRKLHVFKYSDRPLTKAANFPNKVDEALKKERAAGLRDLSSLKASSFAKKQIGKDLAVVFEKEIENNMYSGTSSNYMSVKLNSKTDLRSELKKVKAVALDGEDRIIASES